jgi:transposase
MVVPFSDTYWVLSDMVTNTLSRWLVNSMQQQYIQVLPKSLIGKALAYSLERWNKLSLYITDGRLNVDNNPVENSIRPVVALGRKNYLFAGSHEAAKRSGMLYSLLWTCKMHGVELYTWLKEVLQKIADHSINKIHDLLPHRYKI